jgi:hypothetical protein
VSDASAIYRSSFFPGLGWMLTSEVWQELGPKWPQAYWDDWLREPPQQVTSSGDVSRRLLLGALLTPELSSLL